MTRRFLAAAVGLFLILTSVVAFMGWRAKNEIEQVATDQFNSQQLLLAQKIADDIDEHFAFLKTSLQSLAAVWGRTPAEAFRPDAAVPPYYQMLKHWKVLAMGFSQGPGGPPDWFDDAGRIEGGVDVETAPALAFVQDQAPGKVFVSRVIVPAAGPFGGKRLVVMAVRLPEEGGSAVASGTILLLLDAMAIAREYAHGVRSGATGYAWVVDDKGFFLDHYEDRFLGQHSIEARRERNPELDWSRIENLLRDRILTGQTGTDWYVSGWHRGLISEMKKLAAFSPARPSDADDAGNIWGVCLAAPETEVQGLIGRLVVREWLLVGLFEAVVFCGFVVAMFYSLRFSRMLGTEVTRKKEELVKAQEKLIRSERFAAIGQAAAHISHEIKNPLMLMAGFARQVRKHLPEGDKDVEKLKIIEQEAARLESLLGEVRDFSRPTPPHIAVADIGLTVEDTAKMMAEGLKARGITVQVETAPGIPPVPHDANRVRQVLINLMKNAAEAMPGGGEIRVTTDFVDGYAELRVTDTGGGIPPDVAGRIFEPFCTTKESGTGLGLAVCQRIVEDHKGDIAYASSPGKGTTFTVRLPA